MLPARSHALASSVLRNASRAASSATPLTDPIEIEPRALRPPPCEVKVSKLSNGVRIASVDNGGGVSRLSIALQSGSRYESAANLGISQLIQNAAYITNKDRTALRTVREMQVVGGSLESSSSREAISRNAVFLRSSLVSVMENLAPALRSPLFNEWDVNDVKEMCHMQNAAYAMDQTAVNLELLHKTAFRNGVGNSLYCNNLSINKFTVEQLEGFAQDNYNGEQLVIVGTDVDHDSLMRYAQELFGSLPQGQPISPAQQKYHGGEAQQSTALGFTHASLVSEGAGLFHNDIYALQVLQKVLGTGTYIKWGSNTASSRLNKAACAVTDTPLMINALNLSYSDCGLFGFNTVAPPQHITKILQSAVGEIAKVGKGEINAAELQRAKNQAKASISMCTESQSDTLEDLMTQVMYSGSYASPSEMNAKIDGVTLENLVQVAKKVYGGKPTLAVSGDTTSPPYVDELFV